MADRNASMEEVSPERGTTTGYIMFQRFNAVRFLFFIYLYLKHYLGKGIVLLA